MERARGQDYAGAAACFVDAFFLRRDGGGDRITKGELSYLVGAQKKDLVKRYNQKSLGTMFVIKDEETNEVVGCVGAEVQRFVGATPARRSENDANGVVADRPVVANLAVASSARRKGLAKALMFAIEEEAKAWGFDETVLIVEANNRKRDVALQKIRVQGYRDGARRAQLEDRREREGGGGQGQGGDHAQEPQGGHGGHYREPRHRRGSGESGGRGGNRLPREWNRVGNDRVALLERTLFSFS
jgi:ribosomal protein S18 acetylase RimI-like enzyme